MKVSLSLQEKVSDFLIYWEDCIKGMAEKIEKESIARFYADPPFGIDHPAMENMYYRKKRKIIQGYVDPGDYYKFTTKWISQVFRVLMKGGSGWICSGWTNLEIVLQVIREAGFDVVNHVIWKYQFGVYTQRKFVTSHYHLLFVAKGKKYVFNRECRFKDKRTKQGNPNYRDREDVWCIPRVYHPNVKKYTNAQPLELVAKALKYITHKGETVLDPFVGSGTTAVVCRLLGLTFVGFEINENLKAFVEERLHNFELERAFIDPVVTKGLEVGTQ